MPTQPLTAVETFSNPAPEHDYTIRMTIPEFTCLCPRTGQPDFATLELEYVPDRLCVELIEASYVETRSIRRDAYGAIHDEHAVRGQGNRTGGSAGIDRERL